MRLLLRSQSVAVRVDRGYPRGALARSSETRWSERQGCCEPKKRTQISKLHTRTAQMERNRRVKARLNLSWKFYRTKVVGNDWLHDEAPAQPECARRYPLPKKASTVQKTSFRIAI